MKNLDLLAAETAQEIVERRESIKPKDLERLTTKALGVLQENGVYAAMLFLYSRNGAESNAAQLIRESLLRMLTSLGIDPLPEGDNSTALKFVTDSVCSDLDTLLLVKQVWEQTLIYCRYGAKASE
jgi:cytosine/adenosine deaminase-related metal-dependent hydrolase